MPERVSGVRRTGAAARLSSGIILRATLTFGPAMWQCMSTPPGMTTMPRASIVRSGRRFGSGRRGDDAAVLDPEIADFAAARRFAGRKRCRLRSLTFPLPHDRCCRAPQTRTK